MGDAGQLFWYTFSVALMYIEIKEKKSMRVQRERSYREKGNNNT